MVFMEAWLLWPAHDGPLRGQLTLIGAKCIGAIAIISTRYVVDRGGRSLESFVHIVAR